ncbi:MAG: FtsX-like permease family protein [Candidatus Zophobacter franzmannii]|nr:FtsX-like permease family protein [Candidatus Zophobacter franzmannii]
MFKFLMKGILRDKSRTLYPLITISMGVMLIVFMWCWANGAMSGMVDKTASLDLGHMKIVTRAYEEIIDQKPYDLCLTDVDELLVELKQKYPGIKFKPRTNFGGLLDVPDENGQTKAQGDFIGIAMNLLNDPDEIETFSLKDAMVMGHLPKKSDEILISNVIFEKFELKLNDTVSIITSTMYGSMSIRNYKVAGTVRFGVKALDRGAVLIDNSAIADLLDMENASSEIFCFLPEMEYSRRDAEKIKTSFNAEFTDVDNEFSPYMRTMNDDATMGYMMKMTNTSIMFMNFGLMIMVAIVLWNSGLLNNIRRYGEMGVRLAMGESKGHIYRSIVKESILIGILGSVIGTLLGLAISLYLQYHPVDISHYMNNSSIMMGNEYAAKIDGISLFIGFIPGVLASILGSMLAGRGIYKRQTAQLFKEMEK